MITSDSVSFLLLLCRIIGQDHIIESIPGKGRCLAFSEIENAAVSYLAGLIPHEHLEVPSAQNWWFRSCGRCGSGATEEGNAFRCSKEGCTCRSATPRYKLGVRAVDVVDDMVFFGDTAKDLIGKPADELIVEFLDRNAPMPPEFSRFVGRRCVVEVTVSRFSLWRDRIDFQVLKFFPEGGDSYASLPLPGTSLGAAESVKSPSAGSLVAETAAKTGAY